MFSIPKIHSKRVQVVPFTVHHLTQRYVNWLNDPEVVRYSEQRHHLHTLESCQDFMSRLQGSNDTFCAIETNELGHIGNLVIVRDVPNQTADLSILIGDRKAWRMGYGAEAWDATLAHLLHREGLRKVTAGTMVENVAMLSVIAKTRMVVEGRLASHFLLDGHEVDMVQAAAFANTWQEKPS